MWGLVHLFYWQVMEGIPGDEGMREVTGG